MGEIMKEATFSLAEANFAAGDFRYYIHKTYILYYSIDILERLSIASTYIILGHMTCH